MRGRAGPFFAGLALIGVLALAVFPAKALHDQRENRKDLAAQLAVLLAGNEALEARVAQLDTNEEIERLARQYNLIKPGEEAYFILPQRGAAAAPASEAAPAALGPAPEPKRSPSLWERITSWI